MYTSDMRAHRVRFTTSKTRSTPERATKTRDGVTIFRRNLQGKHAMREALGEQRRSQQSLCHRCGNWLEYEDAVFESKQFMEGTVNHVAHRKCPA
jgi:hypothetical protein